MARGWLHRGKRSRGQLIQSSVGSTTKRAGGLVPQAVVPDNVWPSNDGPASRTARRPGPLPGKVPITRQARKRWLLSSTMRRMASAPTSDASGSASTHKGSKGHRVQVARTQKNLSQPRRSTQDSVTGRDRVAPSLWSRPHWQGGHRGVRSLNKSESAAGDSVTGSDRVAPGPVQQPGSSAPRAQGPRDVRSQTRVGFRPIKDSVTNPARARPRATGAFVD
jgi:hypothetical protein